MPPKHFVALTNMTTDGNHASVRSVPAEDWSASCCTSFYELNWVRSLAEDLFHPGGEALTLKTVGRMNLEPGASLVDLGCGTGSSAMLLAESAGLKVSAVDLSESNIKRARERSDSVHPSINFQTADVHSLPFVDHSFDAALAECTFSLFADPSAALQEVRRVLKVGGQLGVTDMAWGAALPPDLEALLAPWTCLADATNETTAISRFEQGGFTVLEVEDESAGLIDLVLMLKRKLLMLSAGALLGGSTVPDFDLPSVRYWLEQFRAQVDCGAIRYLHFHLVRADA